MGHYNNDFLFWKTICAKHNPLSVLELGAGTGRLAPIFIKNKYNYMGIDISPDYVDFANQKYNNHFHKYDFVDFNLDRRFDLIFIGFNSLSYLQSKTDQKSFFQSVKRHLSINNGVFIIDIFNPITEQIYRDPNKKEYVCDYYDTLWNKKIKIYEYIQYNEVKDILNIKWEYVDCNNLLIDVYKFQMKVFFPSYLSQIIVDNGFAISVFFGDYDMGKFEEGSQQQIYACNLNV